MDYLNNKIPKDPLVEYKLMRIRMKISYEACKRAVSVLELFITALLKAYKKITYRMLLEDEEEQDEPVV
jgi:hypothetical protein